jgi:hypothetical protein
MFHAKFCNFSVSFWTYEISYVMSLTVFVSSLILFVKLIKSQWFVWIYYVEHQPHYVFEFLYRLCVLNIYIVPVWFGVSHCKTHVFMVESDVKLFLWCLDTYKIKSLKRDSDSKRDSCWSHKLELLWQSKITFILLNFCDNCIYLFTHIFFNFKLPFIYQRHLSPNLISYSTI